MDVLHVDCGTCIARGEACNDCVVTVLLGAPGGVVDLDQDERAAATAYPRGPPGSQCPAAPRLAGLRVKDSRARVVDKISSSKYRRSALPVM
jgi:hypothetical protein